MSEFSVFKTKRFLIYLVIFILCTSLLFMESYIILDYYNAENKLNVELIVIDVTMFYNGTMFNKSIVIFVFSIHNPSEIQTLSIYGFNYYIYLNGQKLSSIGKGKSVNIPISPAKAYNLTLRFDITFHKDLNTLTQAFYGNSWSWYIYLYLRMKMWGKYLFLDFHFTSLNETNITVINSTVGV